MRNTIYEVRYTRNDGTFGAYYGENKEAFDCEVRNCEKAGYKYETNITVKHPELVLSHDINNNCTIIKWGESGYYPTNYPKGEYNDEVINELNARRGITPQMRNAMECCSMVAQDNPNLDWEKHYKMCLDNATK